MKEVLMMMLSGCPYCRQANALIQELQEENEKYRAIVINRVDEEVEKELADSLDYFYVPCFFVDGKKLMEGVPSKEKVKAVLDAAIAE
ncbi:MAG: glutaredoxin family protein [Lachnospiraceae bacterium]